MLDHLDPAKPQLVGGLTRIPVVRFEVSRRSFDSRLACEALHEASCVQNVDAGHGSGGADEYSVGRMRRVERVVSDQPEALPPLPVLKNEEAGSSVAPLLGQPPEAVCTASSGNPGPASSARLHHPPLHSGPTARKSETCH